MRLFICISLMWIMISPANAVEIPVRSGEHDGFTRLVLDLPHLIKWDQTREKKTAELTLDAKGITFNTDNTFKKITTDRILSLSAGSKDSSLRLNLNCECEVKVFTASKNMLVIDIVDPPSIQESSNSSQIQNPKSSIPRPIFRHSDFVTPPMNFGPFSSAPALQTESKENNSFHLGFGISLDARREQPSSSESSAGKSINHIQSVDNAGKRLVTQIARAAAQGLLTAHISEINSFRNRDLNQKTVSQPPEPSMDRAIVPLNLESVNLRAQSSIDRAQIQIGKITPQTVDGGSCLSEFDLAIQNWGTDATFGAQIGAFRNSLFGEFDDSDANATSGLIKLYIHFSFGSEATQLLKLANSESKSSNILASMARIMENGFDPHPNPFIGLLECDSEAALWSLLSYSYPPKSYQINTPAILRTLSSLPIHLRSYLGPILSQRLILADEISASKSVLHILNRNINTPNPPSYMARASIELTEHKFGQAVETLEYIVSTDTKLSPEALVKMVETLIAQNKPISSHLAELAGAYALERREDPIGQSLHRIQILTLGNTAHFNSAMDELERFKSTQPESEYLAILSATLDLLTNKSDNMTFLEYILPHSIAAPEKLQSPTANGVALRLIKLGFTKVAARFLVPNNEQMETNERRILLAQMAIFDKKPLQAEAEILGMSGENIDSLRAISRSMVGDHSNAQNLYASLGNTKSSISEAWLAGDWVHLETSNTPQIAAAATLMRNEINSHIAAASPGQSADSLVGENGILAHNHSLLEASTNTRNTITSLLEAMPIGTDLPLRVPSTLN